MPVPESSGFRAMAREHRGAALGLISLLWALATGGVFTFVRDYYVQACRNEKVGEAITDCADAGYGPAVVAFLVISVIAIVCGIVVWASE